MDIVINAEVGWRPLDKVASLKRMSASPERSLSHEDIGSLLTAVLLRKFTKAIQGSTRVMPIPEPSLGISSCAVITCRSKAWA